ncbi:MAG: ABC transporter substrate-binding protein [Clostridiales Family XIII bacterium]|jgi:branched-chain amino acid transport system substrate-binding protein|nr:ABC transporter substrate-binding protein [Clostridiales Family XIII bacterium]
MISAGGRKDIRSVRRGRRGAEATGNRGARGIKAWAAALALALLVAPLTGCDAYDSFAAAFLGAKPSDGVVRVAVFEPLSGKDKANGALELAGIELARALRPQVLGMDVELVVADNKSDIGEAEAVARSLAGKNVSVALGSYRSTLSLAGGEGFRELGIPAISISNDNPLVTMSNDWYFRVCHADAFQGVAMAKYAAEGLGVTKAAVMLESGNDYAQALSQAFSDKFTALTAGGGAEAKGGAKGAGAAGAAVPVFEFPKGTRNFTDELAAIRDAGAGAVFIPLDAETAVSVAEQAGRMGLGAVFLGTELWERDDLSDLAAETVLARMAFSSEFRIRDDRGEAPGVGEAGGATAGAVEGGLAGGGAPRLTEDFLKAYREKYGGREPEPAVALGFDAYMLALDAISRAGSTDCAKIREKLAETRSFPGVSGNISFDEEGETVKSVAILSVRGGRLTEVYVAEPVWGPVEEEAAEE